MPEEIDELFGEDCYKKDCYAEHAIIVIDEAIKNKIQNINGIAKLCFKLGLRRHYVYHNYKKAIHSYNQAF